MCDHEFTLWCSKQRSDCNYIRWRMDRVSEQITNNTDPRLQGVSATMTARDEYLHIRGGHTRMMQSVNIKMSFVMNNNIDAIINQAVDKFKLILDR